MKKCREKFDDQPKELSEEATDQCSESGDSLAQGRERLQLFRGSKSTMVPSQVQRILISSSRKKLKSILHLEVTYMLEIMSLII